MRNINNKKRLINKDLINTGINQLWRLISGPLILIFIPLFLTPQIQGYWYTFTSLSALSVFADLGFSNIVLQFSAHEFAFLKFDNKYNISGDEMHHKKLASFFAFTIKWALLMIVIVFPVIMIIGIIMFKKENVHTQWLIPWIIYLIGAAISFFNTTILSFIEGCNQVAISQKIRFNVAIVNSTVILICLYLRLNLYALAIAMLLSACLIFFYFIKTFKNLIIGLFKQSRKYHYSWKKEFFSLLWKYAISFSSGYFIFQIYTPLMFQFKGSIEAGKVGISMSLWTAIFNISYIWVTASNPKINILISRRKWEKADNMFKKRLILTIGTFILGFLTAFSILIVFKGKIKLLDRFLSLVPMLCLAISWFLQTIIDGIATYLRAHKKEPFVMLSLVSAVYILVSTYLCAKYLPLNCFFLGFLSSYIFSLPWAIKIYKNKIKEWHNYC